MYGTEENLVMARRLALRVREAGGTAYFVGGYVRDALMGCPGKDIDIEVHGLEPARLAAILDGLGERLTMGASFGVFGLRHYEIDIAMPRKERATGRGHKDFEVFVDPFIGTAAAARRRDFTINAMMQDVLSGEIVDHYGGREDLARGVLRHVNDESFAEDPLRVLRGAQFAARFGFEIDEGTRRLCARMDLTALPRERIMGELEKALVKAARPSIFFEELDRAGQLAPWFAEVGAGDRIGRMARLDRAAALRPASEMPVTFMLAALCADMGEGTARALLERLTNDERLLRVSCDLVRNATLPGKLLETNAERADFLRMFDVGAAPEELIRLHAALSGGKDTERLNAYLEDLNGLKKTPPVSGADLIRAGLKPSSDFARRLGYARELWLKGVPHDEALEKTLRI